MEKLVESRHVSREIFIEIAIFKTIQSNFLHITPVIKIIPSLALHLLDEVLPKFNLFLAMSQFDWPITPKKQKNETMETPKNERFYFEVYLGERRTTICEGIWDKSEVLLGTLWGNMS